MHDVRAHGCSMLHPHMRGCHDREMCACAGLDARAANIVIRVVRNVADTGRTIVCTIHQPAIDIFEVPAAYLLAKYTLHLAL